MPPGPLLGLAVLAGLVGATLAWRRFGGPALLPWLTGVVLIITPAATTGYGARYLIPSIPAFCIAAAIGVKEISDSATAPGEKQLQHASPGLVAGVSRRDYRS